MRAGTTPTHAFELPFEVPKGANVRIVYAQKNSVILEKVTDEVTVEGNTVYLTLTVAETLLFDTNLYKIAGVMKPYPVEIQVGIRDVSGNQMWSDIFETTAERCLKKDGVV